MRHPTYQTVGHRHHDVQRQLKTPNCNWRSVSMALDKWRFYTTLVNVANWSFRFTDGTEAFNSINHQAELSLRVTFRQGLMQTSREVNVSYKNTDVMQCHLSLRFVSPHVLVITWRWTSSRAKQGHVAILFDLTKQVSSQARTNWNKNENVQCFTGGFEHDSRPSHFRHAAGYSGVTFSPASYSATLHLQMYTLPHPCIPSRMCSTC